MSEDEPRPSSEARVIDPRGVGQCAVIIPAYNEGARIRTVLDAVTRIPGRPEVIVVSDGSRDQTAQVAHQVPGVTVVDLPENLGKGGAMRAGVLTTAAEVIAFVDADLEGLEPHHLTQILEPILRDECDMCVGVFRGGTMWSDAAQRVSPYLSGQRAMKRDLFLAVPNVETLRMGVEMALTETARRRKARVKRVALRGVSNCFKERKMGLLKGLAARGQMYLEIAHVVQEYRSEPGKRAHRTKRWFLRDR